MGLLLTPRSSQDRKNLMDNELLASVEREVLRWPGVTSEPGRFGAVAFRYGKREIGHVHRDRVADLPVTREVRESLLDKGRARPHRAGSRGYVSYPMEDQEDGSAILEILGWNYDRAKAAERRAASRGEQDEA
jgi:Luciferase